MRFALKAVPLLALGCAAALLVACGDRGGLLSGSESASLQEALASAQGACAGGDAQGAELAAQRFSDRVAALPGSVDQRLIDNLQEGAATLASLVADTCAETTDTTPTTPTTVTTTTVPPTTAETTTPTEPTTPTVPTTPTQPPTTPTTPPDDGGGTGPGNGGGTPGDSGDSGGTPGNPGGAAPGFGGDD